jgi:hypothetical protein
MYDNVYKGFNFNLIIDSKQNLYNENVFNDQ